MTVTLHRRVQPVAMRSYDAMLVSPDDPSPLPHDAAFDVDRLWPLPELYVEREPGFPSRPALGRE